MVNSLVSDKLIQLSMFYLQSKHAFAVNIKLYSVLVNYNIFYEYSCEEDRVENIKKKYSFSVH